MPTDLRRDRRVTPFMQSVYDLVSTIPEGKVSTYGAVAQALRSSARAVGQALRGNPFAPVVPCHRVVASTLELGGFSGTWGDTPEVSKKRTMLVAEGVSMTSPTRISPQSLHTFGAANPKSAAAVRKRPGRPADAKDRPTKKRRRDGGR
uniref:Methylated-DNA--protein-cysteine methyltransferase n=1 Tax=Eutreptiella gymnastica TaxID=73025 RepID=A0A7S4GJ09_9EUGL